MADKIYSFIVSACIVVAFIVYVVECFRGLRAERIRWCSRTKSFAICNGDCRNCSVEEKEKEE